VVDALFIGKPGSLSEHQKFAIDQYLMRGGKLIVLTSAFAIRPERNSLVAQRATTPLHAMLESWGAKVRPAIVMDPQNAAFPIPVSEQRGGLRLQRIRMLPYPFFPDVRGDAFADAQPAFVGITNVTTPWASPLELVPVEGLESEILLSSSEGSWLNASGDIEPDLVGLPDTGFEPVGDLASHVLGVSLSGRFPSYYATRPSPLFEGSEAEQAQETADRTGRTMKQSLPDAKLVVLGSAEMVSDLMMGLSNQPGGEVHRNNLQLVQNLIDWSMESTDMLTIRSSGAFARTLRPMSEAESRGWELAVYGLTALLLLAVTLIPARRRSRVRSLSLGGESGAISGKSAKSGQSGLEAGAR
jgi:ABC-2 type transport system permease protein